MKKNRGRDMAELFLSAVVYGHFLGPSFFSVDGGPFHMPSSAQHVVCTRLSWQSEVD